MIIEMYFWKLQYSRE